MRKEEKLSPPDEDEFETAGLEARPSREINAPGIAVCYSWMECELVKEYEEEKFALLLGRLLLLEVLDEVLDEEGALDVAKAKPLLMTGGKKGMNYCTAQALGRNDPSSAMFPEGKDPLAGMYGG